MATEPAPQADNVSRFWRVVGAWCRTRPFVGGLLLILAGVELFLSANLSLGQLSVHFGPTGFLSYVIPVMLVLCGAMAWATPAVRMFYGVLGSVVAVYSLIGLNFGGFFVGMLLGIVGGALCVAWSPVVRAPDVAATTDDPAVTADTPDLAETLNAPRYAEAIDYEDVPREVQNPERWWAASPSATDGDERAEGEHPTWPYLPGTGQSGGEYRGGEYRGGEYRSGEYREAEYPNGEYPHGEYRDGVYRSGEYKGGDDPDGGYRNGEYRHTDDRDGDERGGDYGGRLLVIALVPATVAAMLLFAANHPAPAYAAPCPTPSAGAATSRPPGAPSPDPAGGAAQARGGQPQPNPRPRPSPQPQPNPSTSEPAAAATSAAPEPPATSTGSGNPFVDGWNDLIDGVKKLFGGDDPATPAPTAPGTPASPSTGTGGSATPTASGPVGPTRSAQPSPSGTARPTARPSVSASNLPCLGPGIHKSAVIDPNQPVAAVAPGLLTGRSLVMTEFTFDGAADLPTATGTVRVLKFSMAKAVTAPFELRVRGSSGETTVIADPELTIQGHVTFYTARFAGKLFGLIPVTFTPESPPPLLPLALPLQFTDVSIALNFVRCDTLSTPQRASNSDLPTMRLHVQ